MLPSQPKPARIAGSSTRSARSISSPRACRLSATRARSSLERSHSSARYGRRTSSCRVTPPARASEKAQPSSQRSASSASMPGSTSASSARRDDARDAGEREDLGVVAGLGQAAQRGGGLAGAPADVGAGGGRAEPQRERQPAGPAGDRLRALVAAVAGQQVQRLALGQRAELRAPRVTDSQPPSNQPGAGGSRPAITITAPAGKRGKQPAAQVSAERAHALVGVEQDERALALPRTLQGLLDGVRQRREVARVDLERRPARGAPTAPDLAQQHALADPAAAVHQQHAAGRVGAEQRLGDQQLPRAADEGGVLAMDDPAGQCAHPQLQSTARPS